MYTFRGMSSVWWRRDRRRRDSDPESDCKTPVEGRAKENLERVKWRRLQ